MGYDVWIACTRGRPCSDTHRDYDLSTSEGRQGYFDYTYEEIGREDIASILDMIIEERIDRECSKVTLVTHGTAANEALVAASIDSNSWSSKVSKIVNLAPCLNTELENFWLPVKDV